MTKLPNEINGIKIIKDLGMMQTSPKSIRKRRVCVAECPKCNSHFMTRYDSIKNNDVSGCKGCASRIHGETNTRLYKIWVGMKIRCYNTKSKSFKNYGGRGIKVCDDWLKDFVKFKIWAKNNGYSENLTIDRIDNDGNYEPTNCRWTTREVQARNKRKLYSHNTSGFRGVSFRKDSKKYTSNIGVDNKLIHIGVFNTAEEAATAYDEYVLNNDLEHTINFNSKDTLF